MAQRIAPLAQGEVAALAPAQTPFRVPDLTFKDTTGADKTLADWRGRTVLLNLWATWCVPCRREMPALDALQAKLGGPDFQVVAVNIDTRDPQKPLAFLKKIGVTHLAYYSDRARMVRGSESGRQSLWHADHRHHRQERLRDRRHGRSGGMGERRRREACQRGDRNSVGLVEIAAGQSMIEPHQTISGIPALIALRGHVQVRSDPGGDVGERTDILLRGVDQFHHRGTVLLVHTLHVRRHGKLRRAGLRADQCRDKAHHVHGPIMALKLKHRNHA